MHDLYLLPIILLISLILTMVGLGGGLFYAPLFILLGFYAPVAVATSLFLSGYLPSISTIMSHLARQY